MQVKDIMARDLVTNSRDATVREVAKQMTEKNVGTVIIVEGRKPIGIVTDREIVVHAIGKGENPDECPIRDVMHENPVTCREGDKVWDVAMKSIEKKGPFRRVPVVNDSEELVGVLSTADLALVAHPLLEAVLSEAHASVRETKVEEMGLKDHLMKMLPAAGR